MKVQPCRYSWEFMKTICCHKVRITEIISNDSTMECWIFCL